MTQPIFNFSAGPSMMPRAVLDKAQRELVNWQNHGTSVMERSHRSPEYMALIRQAEKDFRTLYKIPKNFKILFLQGGARGQFAAVPLNLMNNKGKALYLTSGHWSKLAAEEARLYGDVEEINILTNDNPLTVGNLDFSEIAEDYDYVHYCPNETISGVEIFTPPKVGKAILVADMSSTILSREIDFSPFGVIYAGAQKNLGPSGITIVLVREDLIGKAQKNCPTIWNYAIQSSNDSMINTPPTFAWYLCALVFEHWLGLGGLQFIEKQNEEKAKVLYDYLDQSHFYKNNVAKENRSLMNVTFTTGNADLDKTFWETAQTQGLHALKGHKVLGGMRASIYNAMPLAGVQTLIDFMKDFEQANA